MIQDRVIGYKCKKCKKVNYPYHDRCVKCKGREFEEVELGEECELVTFTELTALPTGFDQRVLYLGVVEFPEKVRATAQLIGEDFRIGQKLRAKWGLTREMDGEEFYGLQCYSIEKR